MDEAASLEAAQKTLDAICDQFGPFSDGWDRYRLAQKIRDADRLLCLARTIPIQERREIARRARSLLSKLEALHGAGLQETTLRDLRDVAGYVSPRTGYGGDRRSRERTERGLAHSIIVQLYIDAHVKPGFSKGGPAVRFVREVCGFLGVKPPSDEAVKALFREIKQDIKKRPGSSWYGV